MNAQTNSLPEIFTILRFLLSVGLIIGGVSAIWFGFRLFSTGAGTARAVDKLDLKIQDVKIAAAGMSVGSVLMLTSGVWGYFAYSSFPKLEMAGDTLKIANVSVPSNRVGVVVGTPVYLSGTNSKVGEISQVLVNGKHQATGVVVGTGDGHDRKQVVLSPEELQFNKFGTQFNAVVHMDKSQFENAPTLPRSAVKPNS